MHLPYPEYTPWPFNERLDLSPHPKASKESDCMVIHTLLSKNKPTQAPPHPNKNAEQHSHQELPPTRVRPFFN